jgi:3-hydroxyisobutyrate dehydrogenase
MSARVAVVGLGNLGLSMAERLRDSGFDVVGHDVSDDAAGRARARGLSTEDDLARCVADAEVVCLAVGTAEQVRTCLAAVPGDDRPVLVHSTLPPGEVRELGRDRPGLVDAPVSGGADRARAGDLAVMVGGQDPALARARPVLDALGTVLLTGEVGSAQAVKQVCQVVFMTTQGALLEGNRLAAAQDVSWDVVLEAVRAGTADCWAARNWGFFDRTAADYDRSGLAEADRPWAKDLRAALATGRAHGVGLPLVEAAARTVPAAIDDHARRADAPG